MNTHWDSTKCQVLFWVRRTYTNDPDSICPKELVTWWGLKTLNTSTIARENGISTWQRFDAWQKACTCSGLHEGGATRTRHWNVCRLWTGERFSIGRGWCEWNDRGSRRQPGFREWQTVQLDQSIEPNVPQVVPLETSWKGVCLLLHSQIITDLLPFGPASQKKVTYF